MTFSPYLFFSGDCAEAFALYSDVFGAEAQVMTMGEAPGDEGFPDADPSMVMHASIDLNGSMLLGSDDPTSDGGPKSGYSVAFTAPNEAEVHRIFNALADGGEVTMPIEATFWSPAFGMVTDRFGVAWMIDTYGDTPPIEA